MIERCLSTILMKLSRRYRGNLLFLFCHRETKRRNRSIDAKLRYHEACQSDPFVGGTKNFGFVTISRSKLVYYGNARPSLFAILLRLPLESSLRLSPLNDPFSLDETSYVPLFLRLLANKLATMPCLCLPSLFLSVRLSFSFPVFLVFSFLIAHLHLCRVHEARLIGE